MSNIKILISCHKPADHPKSQLMLPIQVGAAIAKKRLPGMLYDDQGESISEKNPMYCELTAQYWAWKNLDADYYGFCHYRRYFSFSKEQFKEDPWGNILHPYIDRKAIEDYELNDQAIQELVEQYDVITTTRKDLRKMPQHFQSVDDQYKKTTRLHYKDLKTVLEIIEEKYPEYAAAAKKHCEGYVTSFCNMYILRKDIFQDYCQWMFDVLEEFERRTDFTHYSQEALRTPGHLSERLFGIYYLRLLEQNPNLRVKELQCVLFENTDPQEMLLPAFADHPVPVVFAANNYFSPIFATCLQSVLDHTSPVRNYDLVLLESDVSKENQGILLNMVADYPNVSLRFFDAERLLGGYHLEAKEHISVETFFRFLIQDILPTYEKVLYLDCDLVVREDVAKLYDTDIGNHMLAAARDPDFLGQINGANPSTLEYCQTELKMKDPYQYFQAGVLLLNTKAMREAYSLSQWLTFASHGYKYSDQDVLNLYCEGRVYYLDMAWNLITDCARYRVEHVVTYAPAEIYKTYQKAHEAPKIIHYAGYMKPWHRPEEDYASVFWEYARKTPYYEQLVFRMMEGNAWHVAHGLDEQRRWQWLRNLLGLPRKVVDHFLPKGTVGRERLKRVYHIFVKPKFEA